MFHDMGLLTVILPALGGKYITIMSPQAFVRRPGPLDPGTRGPGRRGRDVRRSTRTSPSSTPPRAACPRTARTSTCSNVIGLINGSEPVTVSSMKKFNDAFAPYGLPKTAIKPCYGMAEATLFVSSTKRDNEAKIIYVDRDELNAGTFKIVDQDAPGAVAQVSCGQVSVSQWAVHRRPRDRRRAARRPCRRDLAARHEHRHGYWGRPEETEETFNNTLVTPLTDGSHSVGAPENASGCSTGDYGV